MEVDVKVMSGSFRNEILTGEYINPEEWFGKTWILGIGFGFDAGYFIIESDNETDVIDEFTDSKFGHLIKTDELCEACKTDNFDNCTCNYAGNFGDRVNLDDIRILERCKVLTSDL